MKSFVIHVRFSSANRAMKLETRKTNNPLFYGNFLHINREKNSHSEGTNILIVHVRDKVYLRKCYKNSPKKQ